MHEQQNDCDEAATNGSERSNNTASGERCKNNGSMGCTWLRTEIGGEGQCWGLKLYPKGNLDNSSLPRR